jgi:hypothetical protein
MTKGLRMTGGAEDGLFWVSCLKKSSKVESDLWRDVVCKAGPRPVTEVSLDDVWSALRFRPPEELGK